MTEDSFSTPRLPRHGPLLGQLLVERGLINEGQLEQALARQRRLGGSLGTILLESEAIAESKLLEMLGVQLSMPTVSAAEMQDVQREVLDLIPARLALRYNLLPFERRGNTLHLAALDPGAVFPVEDEIRMLTSCLLRAHIGLDFRIRDAIRQHYGGPGDVRLQSLARRLALVASRTVAASSEGRKERVEAQGISAAAGAGRESEPTDRSRAERTPASGLDVDRLVGLIDRLSAGAAPAGASRQQAAMPGSSAAEARTELDVGPDSRGRVPPGATAEGPDSRERGAAGEKGAGSAPPQPGSAPTPSAEILEPRRAANPFAGLDLLAGDGTDTVSHEAAALFSADPAARLQEAAMLLQDVELRDDVADAVLAFCAPFFAHRLLFVRRRGQILGWRGEGDFLDLKYLPTVALPADEPSVFSRLETPGAMHCGSLAPLPQHRLLEPLFDDGPPTECVVIPIFLGSKVACYLWLDGARGDGVTGAPLPEIQELARKAGYALEICVLRNRIGSR